MPIWSSFWPCFEVRLPCISGCSLTFFSDRDGAQIKSRGGFVKTEITMTNVIGDQPTLWQDRVLLDEDFYRALREHPVPV